jgi:hypothetical protein
MKTTILKAITLIAICLFSMSSYAQTKEETISWLQEKLEKHFVNFASCTNGWNCYYTFKSVEINECEIEYKCSYFWPFSGGTTDGYRIIIPTKDLKINSKGAFYIDFDGIKSIHTSSTYVGKLSKDSHFNSMDYYFGIKTSGEVDLVNRIQKAINFLGTFCPEKKKEAF